MVKLRLGPQPALSEFDICAAAGDVVAARALADRALSDVATFADRRDARLLLTAACLHLDSQNGPDPTWADLQHLLVRALRAPDSLASFGASPMQFLRFTWAELSGLELGALNAVLDQCLHAVTLQTSKMKQSAV
jgi:hypothetical protein